MASTGTDVSRSTTDIALRTAIRDRIRMVREQLEVHKSLEEMENQRRSVRRPFPYAQRIAAFVSSMPDQSKFYEVLCRDISTTGFSFQAQAVPEFTQLVVELGIPPNAIYVNARIARIQQERDGRYVIGCEFLGRAGDKS